MGCFRLGCAFVFSLIAAVVFTIVGAAIGGILPLIIGGGMQDLNLSSPLSILAANQQGALIGGGIGALIGLSIMVGTVKRASDINWLKKNGTRIVATVADIKRKTGSRQVSYSTGTGTQYRTETYTYYVVTAHWVNPYTQSAHTFHSSNLHSYPRRYSNGSPINVLIDPQNPGRYLVEV